MSLQTPPDLSAQAHADTPLHALSLVQASALIRLQKITPVQLVQAYIDRIERLNGQVNAFDPQAAVLRLKEGLHSWACGVVMQRHKFPSMDSVEYAFK